MNQGPHKATCKDCGGDIDCQGGHVFNIEHICTPCYIIGMGSGTYSDLPEIDDDPYTGNPFDESFERFYDRAAV